MVGQPAPPRGVALPWLGGALGVVLAGAVLAALRWPTLLAGALERRGLDALFREPFWQQVSGFTLLGTSLAALLLPLAKRVVRVGGGALPAWRVAHAGIGLGALGALLVHTSLRAGHHLNLALELSFVALLFLGASAALVGLERPGGGLGRALRLLHIFVLWPLLSLIGLHVLAVYYF
jgi:nitrite reductase (NADH) large subunit